MFTMFVSSVQGELATERMEVRDFIGGDVPIRC